LRGFTIFEQKNPPARLLADGSFPIQKQAP
jgi:hypothetical protein